MAGIEKITNEIAADAEKEAAEIVAAAEASAKNEFAAAEAKCRDISNEAKGKAEKEVAIYAERIQSQCQQEAKMAKLKAKQEMIADVISEAYGQVLNMEDGQYFATLLRLLERNVEKNSKGELLLNEKDLKRKPADFDAKASEIAKAAGGELTVSSDAVKIDGGFILRYGMIEYNNSITEIFEENKEKMQDIISQKLW